MKVIAVIPARGGSIGIPRKNIKDFQGRTLLGHTIDRALESELVTRVWVGTEDKEIAHIAKECGAEHLPRPMEMSTNDVMPWETVKLAAETAQTHNEMPDLFVELHCTYPFRTSATIDGAIRACVESGADGCLCALPFTDRVWREDSDGFVRLAADIQIQDRRNQEKLYMDYYGLANVFMPELALGGNPYLGNLHIYPVADKIETVDINEQVDFMLAEMIAKQRGGIDVPEN